MNVGVGDIVRITVGTYVGFMGKVSFYDISSATVTVDLSGYFAVVPHSYVVVVTSASSGTQPPQQSQASVGFVTNVPGTLSPGYIGDVAPTPKKCTCGSYSNDHWADCGLKQAEHA